MKKVSFRMLESKNSASSGAALKKTILAMKYQFSKKTNSLSAARRSFKPGNRLKSSHAAASSRELLTQRSRFENLNFPPGDILIFSSS